MWRCWKNVSEELKKSSKDNKYTSNYRSTGQGGVSTLSQFAQRAGRAQPTPWTLQFVHKCRNVTHLHFGLLLFDSVSQKIIDYATLPTQV
jgi:hypothetical protein